MRLTKLETLTKSEGFESIEDLLFEKWGDSVVPAICIQPDCDYTVGMEPDQDRGWCENCNQNTVVSALVLAGVI